MSNAGQAILTVVGTVVGAYFGYPQLGFVLGELAGQALFPTQLPTVTGPRLNDRSTTTAQVGDPVIWIFGTDFSPGEVVWLDQIETVTNTDHQGKGGPSQDFTTFSYFQSIALGICGTYPTAAGGPGTKSLSRVWENGKLVYDIRLQQVGESDADFSTRLGASAVYAESFVFYDGNPDQLPDPTIEAARGIGNTPAYRGLCYIVYPRRQLLDSQAQRHPSFRFEVSDCTAEFNSARIFTSSGVWQKPFGLESAHVLAIGAGGGGGSGAVGFGGGDRTGGQGGGGGGASDGTMLADDLPSTVAITVGSGGVGAASRHVGVFIEYGLHGEHGEDSSFGGYVVAPGGRGGRPGAYGIPVLPPEWVGFNGHGGTGTLAFGGEGSLSAGDTPQGESTTAPPIGPSLGKPAGAGGGGGGGGGNNFTIGKGGTGGNGEIDPDAVDPLDYGAEGGSGGVVTSLPPDSDGSVGESGAAGQDSEIFHGGGGGGGGRAPAVGTNTTGGQGAPGGKYGAGGGGGGSANAWGDNIHDNGTSGGGGRGANGIVIVTQSFGDSDPCEQIGSLGKIVAAICERVGVVEIDTADIDDVLVHGYALAKQMPARSAIDPLRSVGWFDVTDVGTGLVCVKRGRSAVATLDADDLGAYESGGTPGPAITTKRSQDPDLPRIVRVHYYAISRDYEFGEQSSPVRISTRATNEFDVELPIALDDQLALWIAEALWADAWTGRHLHETTVDFGRWVRLTGADNILVPVDDELNMMRIVSISDSSLLLRKLTMRRVDDENYDPVSVAAPPERSPTVIAVKAPTTVVVLDIAPLRPEDDDAGVYAAVAPATGSPWTGAVIFRSCDLGATWDPLTAQLPATMMGTLAAALPVGLTEVVDLASAVVVDIDTPGMTPESIAFDQLVAGGNACAVGVDGRWEVLQFTTAEQIGPTRWRLTELLRGRRGTEHVMGTGEIGDSFVFLDPDTLARLPATVSTTIGEACSYRPVTVGATFSSGSGRQVEHVHTGEALRPFSPVSVSAERGMDDDIVVAWTRRDRIGQTLPVGGVVAMSELTEAYEVDVVEPDTSPSNVLRTLAAGTSEEVVYTDADQMADGPLPAYEFRVYQMSAVVGRGTPGVVTFED